MFNIGVVSSTVDYTAGGKLDIIALNKNGDVSDTIIQAYPSSPNIGAGAGFLSVPGPGSYVIYVEAPPIKANNQRVPIQYIWLGAIAMPMLQSKGRSSVSHDKDDPDETDNTQKDFEGRTPSDGTQVYDAGIPEGQNMYADNHLPQQDIWKHRHGHKVVLSHKITQRGTHDTGILVQSALGKKLHINDGNPAAGLHDRIVLSDEKEGNTAGPNRIEIISGGKDSDTIWVRSDKDQVHLCHNGNQFHELSEVSLGDQRRDNRGQGNIIDKAYVGGHQIEAASSISRTSHGDDITDTAMLGNITQLAVAGTIELIAPEIELTGPSITLTCGTSTITMSPESITISSPQVQIDGITNLNGATNFGGLATLSTGVVLDTHIHSGGTTPAGTTGPPAA